MPRLKFLKIYAFGGHKITTLLERTVFDIKNDCDREMSGVNPLWWQKPTHEEDG